MVKLLCGVLDWGWTGNRAATEVEAGAVGNEQIDESYELSSCEIVCRTVKSGIPAICVIDDEMQAGLLVVAGQGIRSCTGCEEEADHLSVWDC